MKGLLESVISKSAVFAMVLLICYATNSLALTLGPFNFNDAQFGDTLLESDGGDHRNNAWLNVVDANPGNPGALTGANVDTGIANIGEDLVYTIGYNTPIANGGGADLGIISARFSSFDTFSLAVSIDGIDFTPFLDFGPELAVNTNEMRTYYFPGVGQVDPATLFVTPVDLSLFDLDPDAVIMAVKITSSPEGDLIRVAGFSEVPEPTTVGLFLSGLFAFISFTRRRLRVR